MRLSDTAHMERPWRIHEMTDGFRLEDVWALPTPGGPDDFGRLVQLMKRSDASHASPAAAVLWAIRRAAGALLGWDRDDNSKRSAFRTLYQTEDEWAAEIVNQTVHGILHIGWVPDDAADHATDHAADGAGGYRGQMAILVKPKGRRGAAYMAFIKPFRHAIIYPAMISQIGRAWNAGNAAS